MSSKLFSLVLFCFSLNILYAEDVLQVLKEGNQRFVDNEVTHQELSKSEREELAKSQSPVATIIVCSDSRVPPELIFDQHVGKLFVIRLAGNVVDQLALASVEFGISVLKTPLILIMGHENCGAVEAAFTLESQGYSANIGSLLYKIWPAVEQVKQEQSSLNKEKQLALAIENNVTNTHKEMLTRSPIIRDLVKAKKVQIVEGVFHISSGKVEFFE